MYVCGIIVIYLPITLPRTKYQVVMGDIRLFRDRVPSKCGHKGKKRSRSCLSGETCPSTNQPWP